MNNNKPLNNCLYNKIKLLHELSSILWFIEHHAMVDSKNENDSECHTFLEKLEKNLHEHVIELKTLLCKCK